MGKFKDFWNDMFDYVPEETVNYLDDYDYFLEKAIENNERLLSTNVSQFKLASVSDAYDMHRVYFILESYPSTSNYLLKLFNNDNITFFTASSNFHNLKETTLDFFRSNTFQRSLLKKEYKSQVSYLHLYVFKELFGLDESLFFSLYNGNMEQTIERYNNEILSSNVGLKSGANNIGNIKDWQYSFKELLDYTWFYNVVKSGFTVYFSATYSERFACENKAQELIGFISTNLKTKTKISHILSLIEALNNDELIEKIITFKDLSESKEYISLDAEYKEQTSKEIFEHLFENISENAENAIKSNKELVEEFKNRLLDK